VKNGFVPVTCLLETAIQIPGEIAEVDPCPITTAMEPGFYLTRHHARLAFQTNPFGWSRGGTVHCKWSIPSKELPGGPIITYCRMPVQVFTGLPGSGKSTRLIEIVNSALSQARPVRTFACSESPLLAARKALSVHRLMVSRRRGLSCPLNHFVSTREVGAILAQLAPGTLCAFEEAQFFGPEITSHWLDASRRGLDVVISTPSIPQLELLKSQSITETLLTMLCQDCGVREASTFVVDPQSETTIAMCSQCNEARTEAVRRDLLERLQRQAPHPGQKSIYQPIDEIPECLNWNVVRPDSKARADLMVRLIREAGLPQAVGQRAATYMDIGCNTGYFCNRIYQLGFYTEGVDVVKADIEVAKILDSYFRKSHTRYVTQDAYAYLEQTQERLFDVTSAFAVFQWLMIQTTVERGITCLEWLFAKTKRLCFLEMGYSVEPQYRERLKVNIDREWVRRTMEKKGGFAEIRIFDAKEYGLMFGRDLFVGIKNETTTARQVEPDRAPRP
jgi:SAM-dependent methyltransferase